MATYREHGEWRGFQGLGSHTFTCGFCSAYVSSINGYAMVRHGTNTGIGAIYICPGCGGPVFFFGGEQRPAPPFGKPVNAVPPGLNSLYEEARRCTSASCNTAAVRICRKMLMNIAVTQGAAAGLKFIEYVDFLANNNYVPPNGRHWVDHIRTKGNEATHEIALMGEQDARELLLFVEMLLRFIYEFPAMVPVPVPAAPPAAAGP
jgi:hypothetical protein